MKKAKKAAGKASYVTTSADDAKSILRSHLRSNGATTAVKGSRAKYASVSQVAEAYETRTKTPLNRGWFGRHLNSANGVVSQTVGGTKVYRVR